VPRSKNPSINECDICHREAELDDPLCEPCREAIDRLMTIRHYQGQTVVVGFKKGVYFTVYIKACLTKGAVNE
jgi:hypothetical protein